MIYVAREQMRQGLPLENRRIMICQPKLVTCFTVQFCVGVEASRRTFGGDSAE